MAPVEAEEGGNLSGRLESRLVHVQIHAVNAFDFQRDVSADDICDSAW